MASKYAIALFVSLFALGAASTLGSGLDIEATFLGVPTAEGARESLKYITSESHVAGTPGDFKMAAYVRDSMRKVGIDANIMEVETLLSYPADRAQLEIIDPPPLKFKAALSEDVVESDPISNDILRNHTYNGYGPSGEATAQVVYANYGRPEDFDYLESVDVSVRGKIVLVRYGECFRGLKVLNAQTRGAVGTLIYSDPIDDGFSKGPVYPSGPWRPESAVQRGSVQFASFCDGDPTRSYLNATVEEVCGYSTKDVIPSIPVQPISYGDALPFLKAMGGPVGPDSWQGGLDITYSVGPSNYTAYLKTNNTFFVGTIPNVIAKIPGEFDSEYDRPVLLGNHRDAWVAGAVDPNSGTASLLEVAKGLGELLAKGWKPLRSIYLCSWSGEEFGLLGSTAFGELNADWLDSTAVAYINVDCGVSGSVYLESGATPSLEDFFLQTARDVPNLPVPVPSETTVLGSGSDYTVFLDNLGVASIDFAFSGPYGVYHSVYDSFEWMATEGDPGFKTFVSCAQLWGLLTLRLADAVVLPFNHTKYGERLTSYVDTLATFVPEGQTLDLSDISTAAARYLDAANKITEEVEQTLATRDRDDYRAILSLNDRLSLSERYFKDPNGLPNRKWFKHVIQSPGLYLGYAADVYPGVTQALRDMNMTLAESQVEVVANRINAAATYLGQ